jgi:hypothetical protein
MTRKPKLDQIVALHAMEDDRGRINVALPAEVRQNHALMHRLHHRVVDLLAEKGMLAFFADDVEERLASLSADIVSDFVAKLLKEGRPATK